MPDVVLSGSLTAADGSGGTAPPAGSVLDLGCEDRPAVSLDLEGTFTGTVVIEATTAAVPAATDWFTPVVLTAAGAAASASLTAAARRFLSGAGIARARLRCTALSSGAPTATLRAGQGFVSAGGGGGGGGAVTVVDGGDVTQGTTTDAAAATDTTSTTIVAFWKRLLQRVTVLIGQLPAALVGGRLDVNVGATVTPANVALDATVGTTNTEVGGLTETAPATDIASSGLNGRLQRVAQRLTSLIALLPAALVNGALVHTGDTAHGVSDAGNPVEIGFGAVAHGANPAAVTAGQRTRGYANRAGIPFSIGGHPNVKTIRANYTAAQTDTALVTVAAGLKLVVTRVSVKASKANTVNVAAIIGFGTVNTPTGAGVLDAHPGIDPGGGFNTGTGSGILGVGADDEDLRVTTGAATGGSIDVLASYFTVES